MSKVEKQQVPKIRFKEFSMPYKNIKMLEMAEHRKFSNGVFNDPAKVGRGYKLINVLNMYETPYIHYSKLTLLDLSEDEFLKNKAIKGDVFFTRSSLVKEGIAWNNVYLDDYEDVTFDGHLIKLTMNQQRFKPIYFHYNFRSNFVRKQIISVSKTGSMTTIGQSDLASINIYYPPEPEQTQIGNFFQQLDKLIELQSRAVESAETYKKAMLQKMFPQKGEKVPRVRFEGFSGDWEEKKLKVLFSFFRGESFAKKDIDSDGVYPCIHYGELFTQYGEVINTVLSKTNIEAKNPSQIGDILMPSSDVTPYGLAKASCLNQKNVFLGGDINILRPIEKISSVFFSYLINFQKNKLLVLVTGSSVKHLYNSDLEKLGYVVPSFEEQEKIGNFFQKLDHNIEAEKKKLEQYQTMKRAMLQRMFV